MPIQNLGEEMGEDSDLHAVLLLTGLQRLNQTNFEVNSHFAKDTD